MVLHCISEWKWLMNHQWWLMPSGFTWCMSETRSLYVDQSCLKEDFKQLRRFHSAHFNFVHILNLHFLYFPSTTWKYERPLTVIQQSLAVSNLVFKFDAFNVLKEALHIFLSSHSDPFIFLSARWCSTLSRRQTSWSWNPLASGLGVNFWTVINHFIILLQLYSFQES